MNEQHKLAELYYRMIIGELSSDDDYRKTYCTICHLYDNFGYEKTYDILCSLPCINPITSSDLPSELWENSLIERDRFYFHNRLRIKSKPPRFDSQTKTVISEPFFVEMRIQFTISDLLDYFYQRVDQFYIQDKARDEAALLHLLNRYRDLDMNAIDIVLMMIDICERENEDIQGVFDIKRREKDAIKELFIISANAKEIKQDTIVWRD